MILQFFFLEINFIKCIVIIIIISNLINEFSKKLAKINQKKYILT